MSVPRTRPSRWPRWIAAALVLAAAGAIVAYKEIATPRVDVAGAPTATSTAPTVLLFADPGEAQSSCGCGEIIRLVRAGGARGVPVREIAPGSDLLLVREHRVAVAPTVLFLDERGRVVARHEGEAPETIAAIRSGLEHLAEARR